MNVHISSLCCPTSPLMVLAFKSNHDAAVPVPVGKPIQIQPLADDDRFVLVTVDAQEFHAFAEDVRDHCRLLGMTSLQ